jgi:lipopolysaccharide transport system ATP-binding protein
MSDIVIKAEGLSKQYHIGGPQKTYDALTDQLGDMFKSPFRRAGKLLRGQATGAAELDEQFWALKDVSFEIKRGEVVGIIGRNGAGKSTLLKILSEITEPSEGYADIYGRVGSLLEVGTGFHPELTGRENIYLNGAILGMKKAEIERKFDEIVAFAEIDKFIDTPVKHYSSGMYVRLAFAVAAHLEPEILLVDEVLAVGDVAFQKKCLGKMGDVAQEGRTVIFVSHNMAIIQTLCQRGIFLRDGNISMDDTAENAVIEYLKTIEETATLNISDRVDRRGKGKIRFSDFEILDENNNPSSVLATGRIAKFKFHITDTLPDLTIRFTIYNHLGHPVVTFNSAEHSPDDIFDISIGNNIVCELDELFLVAGQYRINALLLGDGELQDHLEGIATFDIQRGPLRGRPITFDNNWGSACMPYRWVLPKNSISQEGVVHS